MRDLVRLGAGCLLAALAIVAWSLGRHAPTDVLVGGRTVDALGSYWFQWWADRTLARAGSLGELRAHLAHTDLLFFPWGKDVFRHTGGNLLDALALVPLRRLAGPVLAWNAAAALILTTNGLAAGAWILARGGGPAAAAAAALAALVHPYVLFELASGRPTQAILAPFIAALALAESSFAAPAPGPARRRAVLAGLALGLAGWIYWFAAGFAALAIAVLAPGRPWRRRLAALAWVGGVSFAVTAPAVLPLARALASGDIPGLLPLDHWASGDFALVNAARDPVVMATLGWHWMAGYLQDGEWLAVAPTLGLAAVLAAVAAAARSPRWAVVGALAFVIAVGPLPAGWSNPAYIGLMAAFPPMRRLYWPVRALALTVPLAALGTAAVARRLPPRRRLLALALPAAILAEAVARGQLPLGAWSPEVPRAYHCLAALDGALIELPYGEDHDPLLHQTVHEKPIFGGMNERSRSLVPAEHQREREANSWLHAVVLAGTNPRDRSPWTEADREAIHALGYRWIALRVEPLLKHGRARGGWQRLRAARFRLRELAGEPVYRDDDTLVYAPWGDAFPCGPGAAPPAPGG